MRVAIIGRTEILYNTSKLLEKEGCQIVCILTAKEAPEYTKTVEDFKVLAMKWKIPFLVGSKITEHADILRQVNAEIAVSINYTGVIPQSIIDIFPLGILNAHGGDLPRYRGNACQAWAILNGEGHIGLCIHKMVGGELDSGDIIARDYLNINHNTKIAIILDWMRKRTPNLILEALIQLKNNPHFFLEQQSANPKDTLRCYPRNPTDGKINWSQSAIDILRLVNASNKPFSGAFCYFESDRLIVWDAELVDDDEIFCAVPGQITKVGDGFVEVACLSGKLRILNIEINNIVMHPNSIIKSIRKRLT